MRSVAFSIIAVAAARRANIKEHQQWGDDCLDEFASAPSGLSPVVPSSTAEALGLVPLHSSYIAINAKRCHDDDDNSEDGTESTASDPSGHVSVAPDIAA